MTADDATPPPDAYAIFLHARSAVTSARYPRRLDYTIDVSGTAGDAAEADHYGASSNADTGEIRVATISDEELASPPPVPRGMSFNATGTLCSAHQGPCDTYAAPVGRRSQLPDLIGVPLLAPTYMFGLQYRQSAADRQASSAPEALPVIAVVSTKARDYSVALIDTPTVDGEPTYHLRLTPLRKPKENRLRELWVGTGDYLPRQAVVAGNFTLAPLVDVPWTVSFAVFEGAPILRRESTDATLYLADGSAVTDAAIAFEDVQEPDTSLGEEPLIEPDITGTTLVEPETAER